MKNAFLTIIAVFSFLLISCDEESIINDVIDSKITAKERINEVLQKARTDFAADAQLSAIYGREVDLKGEIDLLNTSSLSAFVYVVRSNQLNSNEFYIPVFGSSPVQSPINFTTMLSFIKDSTASDKMGDVLGVLSTISIDPNAVYGDSPHAVTMALNNGGSNFMSQNPGSKIDMFLVPGKSIDTTLAVSNTADWIVNFYSSDNSLVLWLRGNEVITISGN